MATLFFILGAFEAKHFLCDFFTQTDWMAAGKGRRRGWFFPLGAHAAWHGFWTAAIVAAWTHRLSVAFVCGAIDTVAHFCIDRVKSSPNFFGPYKAQDRWFWILLGADQGLHHATYFGIIFGLYFSDKRFYNAIIY